MTVLNDLRDETRAAFERFLESSKSAELPIERLNCYLVHAIATHKTFLKFAPFEAELSQTKGAWELVKSGEDRVQSIVPKLLECIAIEIKPTAGIRSDGNNPWDATKEFFKECLDNLLENWDQPGELIDNFREDLHEWWDDVGDWLDENIRNF
ncbi:hypothetical protein [Devosia aquimaris]|uniref:hypothetical protein n=1 Tax=Devosia aquimaris TaxID=2866214 RepID=UPI001CD0F6CE|nr:hypothetical protein [Devosia sp. CJK-A8-3]